MRCFAWTIVGLVCGGGSAVGLFFAGMSMWPPKGVDKGVEGKCRVTNHANVTYECITSGKSKYFKINMANVTFKDGSVRQCNTFWTTDTCGGIFGSDKPKELLQGDRRPCHWFESEDGLCLEPGHVEGGIAGSISLWICGALLFPCCLCCGYGSDVKGGPLFLLAYLEGSDPPDTIGHDQYGRPIRKSAHVKGDKQDAGAHPVGGEAATATQADCV